MPGIQIHLAIGKKYLEKHYIKDAKSFLEGIIAPDFTDNKDKSHYSRITLKEDLIESGRNKVIIEDFLKQNVIETDYDKGVLLHLLTDKIFFTEFFSKEYLRNTNYQNFCIDLYKSYSDTNPYLLKKYNITIEGRLKQKIEENIKQSNREKKITAEMIKNGNNIMPIEKLEQFIEEMSNMDLKFFIKKS